MMLTPKTLKLCALLGALTVCWACSRGPVAQHATLSDLAPLRAAFNADSGKVRAILLASPT